MNKKKLADIANAYSLYPKSKKTKAFYYFHEGYRSREVAYLLNLKTATAWRYYQDWLEFPPMEL